MSLILINMFLKFLVCSIFVAPIFCSGISKENYNYDDFDSVIESSSAIQRAYEEFLNPLTLLEILAEDNDTQCSKDLQQMKDDVKNFQIYALKMIDSWGKIPDGLLLGNHFFIGQYDECVGLQTDQTFSGQYCLLAAQLKAFPNPPMGAYTFGTCIPSSCKALDLNKKFFSNPILNQLNLTVGAADENCSEGAPQMRPGDWVVVGLLGFITALAIASTIYEVWASYKKTKPNPYLTIFSLHKNGKALFGVRKGDGQMDCLNGMRTISMFWVILCHTSMLMLYGPVANPLDGFMAITDDNKVIISNGYLSVDTFFFLSGLLVCFVFFRDIGKTGSYDAPRGYLNRYLRLTPPYAMIILLQVTILNYIGDGPVWKPFADSQKTNCVNNWWTGLLYVQNLVNPNEQCLIQTWYLSADMQFYWIAPIILYPLYLWPVVGVTFLVFLTIASTCWSFAIDYANKFPPTPILDTTGQENAKDNYASYNRLAPWLVGITLGLIICGLKARKIEVKLSKWIVFLGWCFSTVVCGACLFGLLVFFHETYSPLQAAAFLAFHRLGWALGLSWIVFACIHGYGGPVNMILSWNFFQPLGKISYSAYLVHISVLLFKFAVARSLGFSNLTELVFTWFSISLMSNFAGIILALLVEYPFMNIDRLFFRDIKIFPYPPPKNKKRDVVKPDQVKSDIVEIEKNNDNANDNIDDKVNVNIGENVNGNIDDKVNININDSDVNGNISDNVNVEPNSDEYSKSTETVSTVL